MKIVITKDYDEMSKQAFLTVRNIVEKKPDAVLGLATGSTPIGMYDLLVKDYRKGGISYARVSTVNLDEYVGLRPVNPQSYAYFMNRHLFDHIDIDKKNVFLPCGTAADEEKECARYNAILDKLKPDVQILGIGSNGHIGFNEPGTAFDSVTHVVRLTENTIKDNARLFNSIDEVPKKAFSMGIKNILSAKKIVVLAAGEHKAQAVYNMINAEISPDCPATALRMHSDVTLIADSAAAEFIK